MRRKYITRISKQSLSGQITVFLSLLLTVIIVFLLTCTEGLHIYLGKGRAAKCVVRAGESVLADYNLFLWEQYHIFAIDKCYGTGNDMAINCQFQEYLLDNLNPDKQGSMSFYNYLLEGTVLDDMTYLTDEEGQILQHQIVQYMKYQVEEDAVAKLVNITAGTASEAEVSEAKKKVLQSEYEAKEAQAEDCEKADTESADEKADTASADSKQSEDVEDPRDTWKNLMQFGIVELVTGRKDISKEEYDRTYFPSSYLVSDCGQEDDFAEPKEDTITFEDAEEVTSLLEHSCNRTSLTNELIKEALVMQYVMEHFDYATGNSQSVEKVQNSEDYVCQNNLHTSAPQAAIPGMEMETEYIIAGKNSDYDNLKNVIYRLLAIRFPINFTYALTDTELMASAQTLAAALAGVTGNVAIAKLAQYLLIACISYAEAVYDLQCLYQGKRVELTKTKANWHLRFSNIAQLATNLESHVDSKQENKAGSQHGMLYEDYLRMLLLLQNDQSVRLMRMLDVMQVNGQQADISFRMQNMVYGFQTDTKVVLKPIFCNVFSAAMEGSKGVLLSYEKYLSY